MNIITYPTYNQRRLETIFDCLPDAELTPIRTLKQLNRTRFDGLVLMGGRDISPQFYGEIPRHSQPADQHRDMVEWSMIRRALRDNKPILGICRGMQLLTVACGGSLWQDIHKQKVTKFNHSSRNHQLGMIKYPLRHWLPSRHVNSRHHQAVRSVPYGMKVLAKSHDGLIEAIWRPGALGVQWHPEDLFPIDHNWIGLFNWLTQGLK